VTVGIEGAHLEADAGKSTHPAGADYSLVDLNRAGTPLLEIVSKPDIHSAEVAKEYARELQRRIKFAGVSEASLFYGNMRFDVNISLAPEGSDKLGTRAEIKNLNSFKSVEKAAEYEIIRQTKILDSEQEVIQETRGWDDSKQQTFSQRSKEDAHDYRYFPEPNIPPIDITDHFIQEVGAETPLLNSVREKLSEYADVAKVNTLVDNSELLDLAVGVNEKKPEATKKVVSWLTVDLIGLLRSLADDGIFDLSDLNVTVDNLLDMFGMIELGELSSSGAKSILEHLLKTKGDVRDIASKNKLIQSSDNDEIEKIAKKVIEDNKKVAEQIRAGEDKAIGFLIGQVMKLSAGSANPKIAQEIIRKLLKD